MQELQTVIASHQSGLLWYQCIHIPQNVGEWMRVHAACGYCADALENMKGASCFLKRRAWEEGVLLDFLDKKFMKKEARCLATHMRVSATLTCVCLQDCQRTN